MRYVLGFVFDTTKTKVLVIKKNRPEWQQGLFNGIGGKIETLETSHDAMVREFMEETGCVVSKWDYALTIDSRDFEVDVYMVFDDRPFREVKTTTDEEVCTLDLMNISWEQLIKSSVSNLPWLLNLLLDPDFDRMSVRVHYSPRT